MIIAALVGLPFLEGILLYIIGQKNAGLRDVLSPIFGFAGLLLSVLLLVLPESGSVPGILTYGLSFTSDPFRRVYSLITALMWAFSALFSREYFRHEPEHLSRFLMLFFFTLGATQGVMLSGDVMTSFVFFEILSFTSFPWVIHEETEGAVRAGKTYFFIAVIGGLLIFLGLVLLYHSAGTLSYGALPEAVRLSEQPGRIFAAGIFILLGFGCKAGMFPVHVWLPKAHPVAPSPASALLSGILTKVGIFGILMTAVPAFFGNTAFGLVVLILGTVTMALGAVLALLSVNLKRTLACSSMSQIGFILVGIGSALLLSSYGETEGLALALSGTVLHMINHSLFKLVLFLCSGVCVMTAHTLSLDELRGFGRRKWPLAVSFIIAALGISGVPRGNGYISKTMLHEGLVMAQEYGHEFGAVCPVPLLAAVEWIFLVSGGLTFAYMLKLSVCLFIEKNPDPARQAAYDSQGMGESWPSALSHLLPAVLLPLLGEPRLSVALAAWITGREEVHEFSAFTWGNLKGGLISLGIGAAVYLVVVRHILMKNGSYLDRTPYRLDLEDRLYRPLLLRILPGIGGAFAALFGENRISRKLAAAVLALGKRIAALFGENRLLIPICRILASFGALIANLFAHSLDFLISLTKFRVISKIEEADPAEAFSPVATFFAGTKKAVTPIMENFSFALLMTCIGILVILGVILLTFVI